MRVYADNAATTAICQEALDAMLPVLKNSYGNPSSIHSAGRDSSVILESSRNAIARCINAQPKEIYFTSGGTESDNWAIHSAAAHGAKQNKRHIISTKIEHHAVMHTLEKLEKQGYDITLLNVHSNGIVRPEEVAAAIRQDTCLVTIMYANNEIGTIQPISKIGEICRSRGVPFHTDAVQAVGHIPVDVQKENIDMLSLSAHKFHGPKGVGVLYHSKKYPLSAFMDGGAQERGKRGGTENIPGIAGMTAALEHSCKNMDVNNLKVSFMRDLLIKELSKIPRSHLNGDPNYRLPGIVNFCFEGIEGESLLLLLDNAGICASSGSACTSGSLDPSHVLLALGLPHEIAHGSLRFSLSEFNTPEEIDYIIKTLPPIVERLRGMSPVWKRIEKGESYGL